MEFIKKLAEFASQRSALIVLLCVIATSLIIAMDLYMGVLSGLPGKTTKSIGKILGKISEVVVFITVLYYALREVYRQIKRRQVMLPSRIEKGLMMVIRIARFIHPVSGSIVLCLVILHGYILAVVWPSPEDWAIWSGLLALALLTVVSVSGWIMRISQPALALRKGHRYMGLLLLFLYLCHKVIAD
ncbi:MAG: hypothetical protein H6Q67_1187 [Firmicutes bacterium]|nr:hypothetical protein [Bacillota bacterium]